MTPAPEGSTPIPRQGTGVGRGGVDEGVPTRSVSPPAPSIELITEAQQLWHRRRTDPDYRPFQHEADLFALEKRYGIDVRACQRCEARHATLYRDGRWYCHWCWDDEVDLGWERYRDATS